MFTRMESAEGQQYGNAEKLRCFHRRLSGRSALRGAIDKLV